VKKYQDTLRPSFISVTSDLLRIRLEKANIEHSVTKRHCSFLPMAHIYERFVILQCLLHGGQIVFCPTPEKLPSYLLIV
ncbi:unnamed protein product, partial [Adineta steineri]